VHLRCTQLQAAQMETDIQEHLPRFSVLQLEVRGTFPRVLQGQNCSSLLKGKTVLTVLNVSLLVPRRVWNCRLSGQPESRSSFLVSYWRHCTHLCASKARGCRHPAGGCRVCVASIGGLGQLEALQKLVEHFTLLGDFRGICSTALKEQPCK
jgi:hypothetical protein